VLKPATVEAGRPVVHKHVWELKYAFNLFDVTQYAAVLLYKIEGTGGTVDYVIETTPFANYSACRVVGPHVGHCAAAGLTLTFKDPL
jgi:hypothetical protein